MREHAPVFPELEKQILARGLLKKRIAADMGINPQTLSRKLTGRVEFTWKEICYFHSLFPNMTIEQLFGIE